MHGKSKKSPNGSDNAEFSVQRFQWDAFDNGMWQHFVSVLDASITTVQENLKDLIVVQKVAALISPFLSLPAGRYTQAQS